MNLFMASTGHVIISSYEKGSLWRDDLIILENLSTLLFCSHVSLSISSDRTFLLATITQSNLICLSNRPMICLLFCNNLPFMSPSREDKRGKDRGLKPWPRQTVVKQP